MITSSIKMTVTKNPKFPQVAEMESDISECNRLQFQLPRLFTVLIQQCFPWH